MRRRVWAIGGAVLLSIAASAVAQAKFYETELCDVIGAPEMATRVGGKPSGLVTDFDRNTQVAICKRSFDLGRDTFFVQATFLQGLPESDAARPESVSKIGHLERWVVVSAIKGRHEVHLLAGYETAQELDDKLTRTVIGLAQDFVRRWPAD